MDVAIVTMVYNERVNLPLWVRHYTRHCPGARLFVVDHGSDDGSTAALSAAHVLPLPRTPFDDAVRAEAISDLQHALLGFFEVVIYTDCDEMLVADPRRWPSLTAFLAELDGEVVVAAPTGLNVVHVASDPTLDLSRPILSQRRHVRFASGMCKPLVTRAPVRWSPGFHRCDRPASLQPELYNFHLASMDRGLALRKLQVTRSMEWTERARRDFSPHMRESDEERIRNRFDAPASHLLRHGVAAFDFEGDLARLRAEDGFRDEARGFPYFQGTLSCVPDEFAGLI